MYNIYKIDVNNLTEKEIQDLFLANKKIVNKYNHLDRFYPLNNYKNIFLSGFTNIDNELFILERDSLICGILTSIKAADWSGKEQYKLTISLCESIIDEAMINALNKLIEDKLNDHGELAVVTYNNELEELIKKHTNKVNLRGNYYTLKKEDIDIDMVNKAIKDYETMNEDLTIKYTDIISEEYIEEYCSLFTETMKDMTDVKEECYEEFIITPEKQRLNNVSNKERNVTHHCYMIFNSNNEMVAKSNLSVNNNDPRFPYQFMIGVKRAYRGRSLGKWLYASMYIRLYETVDFDRVLVCHHPENNHAIDISEWVGYKFIYLQTIYVLHK